MSLFKYIISTLLAVSTPSAGDGWFPVEREVAVSERSDERDSSIWVLFAKNLGEESFVVRFPDEPHYRYLEGGGFTVFTESNGEIFELTILKGIRHAGGPDLHYKSDGKWVREHFVETEHHLFHFKTLRNTPDDEFSNQFFFSFLIDKNS